MLFDLHHEGSNVGLRATSAAPANHVQWYYPAGTPPSPFHHHQHHHHQPVPFYGYVHLWMDLYRRYLMYKTCFVSSVLYSHILWGPYNMHIFHKWDSYCCELDFVWNNLYVHFRNGQSLMLWFPWLPYFQVLSFIHCYWYQLQPCKWILYNWIWTT